MVFPDNTVTAVKHLETYWAILEKVKGSTLRLTKIDDEIYEHLCKDFPEFNPAEPIIEDKMKSPEGKKRWREFMMAYENKVDDYSFGTILRTDPKEEYTQHGTIFGEYFIKAASLLWLLGMTGRLGCASGFHMTSVHGCENDVAVLTDTYIVPRMQFYAIEIARNRKGLNDWVYEQNQAEKAKK